jgi:hypothetical protein
VQESPDFALANCALSASAACPFCSTNPPLAEGVAADAEAMLDAASREAVGATPEGVDAAAVAAREEAAA